MSGFRDMLIADIHNVFLNLNEFGESRTVIYDGETYEDVPIVIRGFKEEDRNQPSSDHMQGLYRVTSVMHCARSDLGGKQPEKGALLKIDDGDGSGFFRSYYVAASDTQEGMLRVELEAVDE